MAPIFQIEKNLRLHHVDNLFHNCCHKFNVVKLLEICVNDIIFNSVLRKVGKHYSIPIFCMRNYIITSMQLYLFRQKEIEFPKYLQQHRKRRAQSSKRFSTRVIRKRVKCHLCEKNDKIRWKKQIYICNIWKNWMNKNLINVSTCLRRHFLIEASIVFLADDCTNPKINQWRGGAGSSQGSVVIITKFLKNLKKKLNFLNFLHKIF